MKELISILIKLINRLKMYYDDLEEMPSVIYSDPCGACEEAIEELEELLEDVGDDDEE